MEDQQKSPWSLGRRMLYRRYEICYSAITFARSGPLGDRIPPTIYMFTDLSNPKLCGMFQDVVVLYQNHQHLIQTRVTATRSNKSQRSICHHPSSMILHHHPSGCGWKYMKIPFSSNGKRDDEPWSILQFLKFHLDCAILRFSLFNRFSVAFPKFILVSRKRSEKSHFPIVFP